MKKRSVNWEDLLTLAVLSRTGSYSAAARELGLTHATVGRRMRRLEESAGAALVVRRDTGFELTKAGQTALRAAEDMERIAGGLGRSLEADAAALSGKVRITATEVLGSYFFLPRLAPFHAQNPAVTIELMLDHRTLSLSRRKADIAIRLAKPSEEDVVAKRLGTMGYGLYIRHDHPRAGQFAGASGMALPVCRLDESMAALPESQWLARHLPNASITFASNSLVAIYQAVKAGWGAGLLPCFLAAGDHELASLASPPVVSREIWLAYPREYRNAPRFRAVIDYLATIVKDAAALLEGHSDG